eukprot:TRINITY_DN28509_c0_g1_i2.p1 TRINITY_DN28509_c0_g1~~TRINITY_DN28509_c0_g1_i2.p1  ORF type:complete len:330 (+),score=-47.26 TRINITY_DN28509_c0_g1_i2:2-991(+)
MFFFQGYGDHRDLHRVDRRQRQMCIRDRTKTNVLFDKERGQKFSIHIRQHVQLSLFKSLNRRSYLRKESECISSMPIRLKYPHISERLSFFQFHSSLLSLLALSPRPTSTPRPIPYPYFSFRVRCIQWLLGIDGSDSNPRLFHSEFQRIPHSSLSAMLLTLIQVWPCFHQKFLTGYGIFTVMVQSHDSNVQPTFNFIPHSYHYLELSYRRKSLHTSFIHISEGRPQTLLLILPVIKPPRSTQLKLSDFGTNLQSSLSLSSLSFQSFLRIHHLGSISIYMKSSPQINTNNRYQLILVASDMLRLLITPQAGNYSAASCLLYTSPSPRDQA